MSTEGRQPLLIFPCNGNGIEALDCLGETYDLVGFVDDSAGKQATRVHGFPVFAREALLRYPNAQVLAVPGSPTSYRSRREVIDSLGIPEGRFATVVHAAARVSPLAQIGRNVLIMAGVVITSNAVIGDHVCILPNTVIHHDVVVGAWTLIGSGVTVAGGVTIGENCYVGSGSSIMNGIDLGGGSLVGLGSNVIRNVLPECRVGGNPARDLG
ncbi:MAG: NeuD/PglB/VioB family sugar acetyltransferase [Burkholderiales bacterium]